MLKILDEFSLEELTNGDIEHIFNNLNRLYPCKENAPIEFEFSGEKYFLLSFAYFDYDGCDFISSYSCDFISTYSIRKTSLLSKDEIYNIIKIVKALTNISSYSTKINGSDDEIYKILKFLKVY